MADFIDNFLIWKTGEDLRLYPIKGVIEKVPAAETTADEVRKIIPEYTDKENFALFNNAKLQSLYESNIVLPNIVDTIDELTDDEILKQVREHKELVEENIQEEGEIEKPLKKKTSIIEKLRNWVSPKVAEGPTEEETKEYVVNRLGTPITVKTDGLQLFFYVDGELIKNEPLADMKSLHTFNMDWREYAEIMIQTAMLDPYIPDLRNERMIHPLYYAISTTGTKENDLQENLDYIGWSPKEASSTVANFQDQGLIEQDGNVYYLTASKFFPGDYIYDLENKKFAHVIDRNNEVETYQLNDGNVVYTIPFSSVRFATYPMTDRGEKKMSLVKSLVEVFPYPKVATDKRLWKDAVAAYFRYFWDKSKTANFHAVCMLYNKSLGDSKFEPIKSASKTASLIAIIPMPESLKIASDVWAKSIESYLKTANPFDAIDYAKIALIAKKGGFETDEPLPEQTSLPSVGNRGPKEPDRDSISPDESQTKDAGFETDEPLPEQFSLPSIGPRGPKEPARDSVSPDNSQTIEKDPPASSIPTSTISGLPKLGNSEKGSARIETGLQIEKGQDDLQANKTEEPDPATVSKDKSQTKDSFYKFVNAYVKGSARIETGLQIEKGQDDLQANKTEEPDPATVSKDKSQTKDAFAKEISRLVK